MPRAFYNPFDAMSFTYDRCFLCGHELGRRKTAEHVFPKWLQQTFSLTNQKMHLLNRTTISISGTNHTVLSVLQHNILSHSRG